MNTDVLVIGGGPAGATAATYIARAGFQATLIYRDFGALEKAERVDNFYGFTKISGKSLVEKGLRQARLAGAKTVRSEVVGLAKKDGNIIVETESAVYVSRAALLAVGASRRTPKINGLADFEGRGVSHCAICDGFFFRGKDVAVLGNGAYALHEVSDLLPLAKSVTILTNGKEPTFPICKCDATRPCNVSRQCGTSRQCDTTRPCDTPRHCGLDPQSPACSDATPITIRKEKIETVFGNQTLGGVTFAGGENLPLAGLFVAEGIAGSSELAQKIGAITDGNFITADENLRTNVSGLWAAGDCTCGMKQIVKAAYDGAVAAASIISFLKEVHK